MAQLSPNLFSSLFFFFFVTAFSNRAASQIKRGDRSNQRPKSKSSSLSSIYFLLPTATLVPKDQIRTNIFLLRTHRFFSETVVSDTRKMPQIVYLCRTKICISSSIVHNTATLLSMLIGSFTKQKNTDTWYQHSINNGAGIYVS